MGALSCVHEICPSRQQWKETWLHDDVTVPINRRREETTTEALSMADEMVGVIDDLGKVLLGLV